MKVLILAGGLGTRLTEETGVRPKPMVEIGGKPILWHIMKMYSFYGFNDFVVLTGYKSHVIKDFFINYAYRYSDLTVDLASNAVQVHKTRTEPWKISILYTGEKTMTGGRIKQAKKYVENERFLLTYGDGVSDINIKELIEFHDKSKSVATLTAVRPTGRFGVLDIADNGTVNTFREKNEGDTSWINGGFFVCEPEIFDYIPDGDDAVFERKPLETLAAKKQLTAYKHKGFWRPMDTLRDKMELNGLWESGEAPWANWLK